MDLSMEVAGMTITYTLTGHTYTLTGQVKAQSMYRPGFGRYGGRFLEKRWAAWRDDAIKQLMVQRKRPFPLEGPVSISVVYFHRDRRRRDADNLMKAIFHILVRAQIVKDDSQFQRGEWTQQVVGLEQAGAVIRLEYSDDPQDVHSQEDLSTKTLSL
jgi:Holliday junction resolvase RusA-like endonuclease